MAEAYTSIPKTHSAGDGNTPIQFWPILKRKQIPGCPARSLPQRLIAARFTRRARWSAAIFPTAARPAATCASNMGWRCSYSDRSDGVFQVAPEVPHELTPFVARASLPAAFLATGTRPAGCPPYLPQQLFRLRSQIRFIVAILHDDRRIQRQIPISRARRARDGARSRHYHRTFRHDQRMLRTLVVNVPVDDVVERRGPGDDGARTEHGAPLDDGSFVDAAIAADQHVVFDNHGHRTDRLQHAADLRCRAQVNALTDLRT